MAGIAGTGIGSPVDSAGTAATLEGGVFSVLARAQYAALAAMRWNAFRNGLRSSRGALEAAASGLNYLLYGLMGLGVTAGLGGGAYSMISKGEIDLLPVLFWTVFLLWQATPLVMASYQQQFDLAGLLRFPLGFAPFYLLHLIFGMVDSATLLGCLGSFGVWAGISIARLDLSAWAALALAVFGVFNLLLSRAIFAWLDRWLAKRKTREILSMLFLVGMLSLQFLNPAVHNRHHAAQQSPQSRARLVRELVVMSEVQRWLPPGIAGMTIREGARHQAVLALGSLGLLGLWSAAAALLLGARLRALHRGEYLSDAPIFASKGRRARVKSRAAPQKLVSIGGSGPIGAIIEKDVLTIMRSLPLLYALGAPLVMVVIFASLMRGPRHGAAFPLAVPLCIGYALLGFTQLIYNSLGAEGAGIQLLLYSPTPMRTVLFAKNILHATLFCAIAVLAGLLAILRVGLPSSVWLAATAAWLVFALPAHLATGNIFSLTMPHRLNLGRIGRQRGGQASALLGTLAQVGILAVGVIAGGLCAFFGNPWLAVPILLVLAVPAWIVWMRVLAQSDAIALRRRDELVTALAKID
jgi:ABC-2 type transport system permease protein